MRAVSLGHRRHRKHPWDHEELVDEVFLRDYMSQNVSSSRAVLGWVWCLSRVRPRGTARRNGRFPNPLRTLCRSDRSSVRSTSQALLEDSLCSCGRGAAVLSAGQCGQWIRARTSGKKHFIPPLGTPPKSFFGLHCSFDWGDSFLSFSLGAGAAILFLREVLA